MDSWQPFAICLSIKLKQNKIDSAAALAEISAEGIRFQANICRTGMVSFMELLLNFYKDFCSVFKISTEI